MQDRTETNIGEYLAVLRRRWLTIVACTAIAMIIVAAMNLSKTPVYQASAQLLLQPKQSESIFQPSAGAVDPTRAVQNELKIINSLAIQKAVEEAYGQPIGISAVSAGEDDVIILSATSTDPVEAAKMVNVYAKTYQTERLNAIVADLAESKQVLQQQVDDFQAEIDALNAPLAELDATIAATPVNSQEYAQLVPQRERLNTEINGKRNDLQNQLNDYQQRLQILQLSERITTTGGVQILNPATTPSAPISSGLGRDLVQGGLIGLFIGVALAFLLEQLDDSVRTSADLARATKGLPTLGLIPQDDAWKNSNDARLCTIANPMGAPAESYRGLRTALQYMALNRPLGVVQLTSASANEGKTSTTANLAVAFADAGMRVAVVGADLRRPRIHQFFQVDSSVGLTSVLLSDTPLDEALQVSPLNPNISVLPSGPRPANPSELLSLDRTAKLIRSLLHDHAIVLVDSPPILPVTDALVLSRCVDAALFVARSNHTSKRDTKQAIERLRQVSSPLIGSILNGVSDQSAYGSMYEYYGYLQPSRSRLLRRFKKGRPDVPKMTATGLPIDDPFEPHEPTEQPPTMTESGSVPTER